MLGTDNRSFLSNIVGFVTPHGAHHDPEGMEGLATAVATSYTYGTRRYPNSLELFTELEKTGALFNTRSGEENMYVYILAPKENIKDAFDIVTHIVHDVSTSDSDLLKIKELLKVRIDDLRSSPERYAKTKFANLVLKERPVEGSKDSVERIAINDVETVQKRTAQESYKFSMSDPENFELDPSYTVFSDNLVEFGNDDQEFFLNLEKDLEQKVILLGFRTEGFRTDKYPVRQVASSVMGGGFTGLVVDEIREKNSAAYYASYSHELMSTKGAAYMYAGVSEENLIKSVELMLQLFDRGVKGDIDDETLSVAKEYFLGRLDRTYDSLESLSMAKLWFEVNGKKMPAYNELVDQIRKVTIQEVADYFSNFVNNSRPYLVVNGTLSDEVNGKLSEMMKDV